MPEFVDAFNAKGGDTANLQIVPQAELVQKCATAAAGGSTPDAPSLDLIYKPAFAEAGHLRDLTEFAQSLPYCDSLSKAHLSVGTVNDRLYGLPFWGDASVLFWNKDPFQAVGLAVKKRPQAGPRSPRTRRRLAPSEMMPTASISPAIAGAATSAPSRRFSGQLGAVCSRTTAAPRRARRRKWSTRSSSIAAWFCKGWFRRGRGPTMDQFVLGLCEWQHRHRAVRVLRHRGAQQQFPDLDNGVSFLPGQEKGQYSSFAGGDNFVISTSTDASKIPAILAFLEYAYSLEGQTILAQNGAVPVRNDNAAEAFTGLDERYLNSADAMAAGNTPYTIVFNDLISSRNGPWISALNQAFFAETAEETREALELGQDDMQYIIDQVY